MFLKQIRISIIALTLFTVLTGVLYPLAVTGIAQVVFPERANGSFITLGDSVVGSELIGQPFSDDDHFWGRPSMTGPTAYNAGASSGSNLGPTNPALLDGVLDRVRHLRSVDTLNTHPIPVDLVTSSSSGLDPHISVASALFQIPRVARVRGMSETAVRAIVDRRTEGRQFGFLGESRVNVLLLNLDLDAASISAKGQ